MFNVARFLPSVKWVMIVFGWLVVCAITRPEPHPTHPAPLHCPARRRQSPAPFLFCVQLMVPCHPPISLVASWAAPMPVVGRGPEQLIDDYEEHVGPAPDSVRAFFHALAECALLALGAGWSWAAAGLPCLVSHDRCRRRRLPACSPAALLPPPTARRFVEGGEGKEADARRNKKFKLIPNILQARGLLSIVFHQCCLVVDSSALVLCDCSSGWL